MKRHIDLHVCAGLANRLRATVSGICAAEKLGCSITIAWPKEAVFGATWTDLFESDLPSWITFTEYPIKGTLCLTEGEFDRIAQQTPVIRIKSYGCFQPMNEAWFKWLRRLRPRPEFLPAFPTPPIGVHIRRTDNTTSMQKSPTIAFVRAMDALPRATFFLATDDPAERAMITKLYPGRVITFPTECYHRDLKRGIEEGFREFLGLAHCSEILGSQGSSFSELAAWWGDIPLRLTQYT